MMKTSATSKVPGLMPAHPACYYSSMDTQEERFHRLLAILAVRCREELDEIEIEVYDRNLSPHGYGAVCAALERILIERSPNDRFPSVGTILARMGAAHTSKSLAMDVANRINKAIGTKGWNWSQKVPDLEAAMLEYLGVAGVAVVKNLGGWDAVCQASAKNPSGQFNAWLRDSAAATIEIQGPALLEASALPPRLEHKG